MAAAVAAVALLVGGQPFDGESSLATAPAAATADLPAENVIVRFEPGTPAGERAEARDDANVRVEETLPLPNTQLVTPEAGVSPDEAAEQLERSPAVRYA